MLLARINSERDVNKTIERIEIVIGDDHYTITEEDGSILLNAHYGSIVVMPCVANEIRIGTNNN